MISFVYCANCGMILRRANGEPIDDNDPEACNCGAPLDLYPPVVILELSGDRYHFGNLTDMAVWLSEVVAHDPEALYVTGMFFWTSRDMLPIMGCVDYQEGDES